MKNGDMNVILFCMTVLALGGAGVMLLSPKLMELLALRLRARAAALRASRHIYATVRHEVMQAGIKGV